MIFFNLIFCRKENFGDRGYRSQDYFKKRIEWILISKFYKRILMFNGYLFIRNDIFFFRMYIEIKLEVKK